MSDIENDVVFLFQTGAIKSEINISLFSSAVACFYSKLVRLKVKDTLAFLQDIVEFLFQTGAIKRRFHTRTHHLTQHVLFLFQTGAIKRLNVMNSAEIIFSSFLFQTGAIKSDKRNDANYNIKKFLFQTGAIKREAGDNIA